MHGDSSLPIHPKAECRRSDHLVRRGKV